MALDYMAIVSYGVFPTPTPTTTRRAALAVSFGLLNITLPTPTPTISGLTSIILGKIKGMFLSGDVHI